MITMRHTQDQRSSSSSMMQQVPVMRLFTQYLCNPWLASIVFASIALWAVEARCADIQTEWNAIAGAADAPPGIDNNPANYLFDIGTLPNGGTIEFIETPGPDNWGQSNQRTMVGNGPFGNGANPAPTQCVNPNPACNANTQEQCVDAHSFMQRANNFGQDLRCLAGTALIYTRVLQRLENCGARCYVDVTSLGDGALAAGRLTVIPMIGAAAAVWALNMRNDANARLSIRITVGHIFNASIPDQLRALDPFLAPANNMINAADLAKMTIRGMNLSRGNGNPWSHAKLFSVLNASDQTQSIATLGGQNHWPDYFAGNRPFDSTMVLTGAWARAPSYGMDGAVRVFRANANPPYYRYNPPAAPALGPNSADMGVSAKAFLGTATDTNINVAAAQIPSRVIALYDMGNLARAASDRTIFFGLGAVTQAQNPQNANNNIFAWVQDFCGPRIVGCGGRSRHASTFVRSVAAHIVNPAQLNVPANKIRLLMAGNSNALSQYAGRNPGDVFTAFQNNGAATACVTDPNGRRNNLDLFAAGFAPIKVGNMNCFQSVAQQLRRRSQLRWARARNNNGQLVPAGQHHKIFVFDNAAFVGSFNPYPSGGAAGQPDSILIENGLWTFDQASRNSIRGSGNRAWGVAREQWGGPDGDPECQNVPPMTCIVGSPLPFECCRMGVCPGNIGAVSTCQ